MISRFRFRFTAVTLLVLIALGGLGYGIYDMYTPRTLWIGQAIQRGDLQDVKRWLRHDPSLVNESMNRMLGRGGSTSRIVRWISRSPAPRICSVAKGSSPTSNS